MPLWLLMVFAVFALGAAGLGAKLYFDHRVGPERITWIEYAVSMVAISLFICPLVGWAGAAMARKDNTTFVEFWNGWEARARVVETTCYRDGPCRWDYDCDPYLVPVQYECGDSKQSRTCTRYETRYHQCPYTDSEFSYYVDTTLGTYTIDSHRLPVRPNSHRWRSWHSVPRHVIDAAGTGEPDFWTRARTRIAQGNPWPVTKTNRYENFVLASRHTILREYRGAADDYLAQGLMPSIATDIRRDSFYRSDKVYMIGCDRRSYASWNDSLERLNGALGSELHGDVHLVLVCSRVINLNPDQFRYGLEAYWQDTSVFRRGALPKNAIVVIVGTTDQRTVAWARAFTGMPSGNELMLVTLQNRFMASRLIAWDPGSVIGSVTGVVRPQGDSFRSASVRQGGVLADVLWGTTNKATRFQRVSMSAKDEGDIGSGFRYLATEVVLSGLQKFLILLAVVLISLPAFSVIAFNDFFAFLNNYNLKDTFRWKNK